MHALRPFQLAIDMAKTQRDEAARHLAVALQNQQAAQNQMDQLQAYARETEGKWMARAQVTASPELMQHHYQFMAKLDEAIAFQVRVIQNHAYNVDRTRGALISVEQRLARFTHILAARQAEITQLQARRDQRQTDELASRMGRQSTQSHTRRYDAEELS